MKQLIFYGKGKAASIIITSLVLMTFLETGIIAIVKASTQITIVDDLGRTVTIRSSERIVSIGPSCTETLYALGLGNRIIGVDRYSDYPPEVIQKQKISNWWNPDPEEVAALNPDVVFYSVGNPTAVEALEKAGLTVVALRPRTINDIFKNIKLVGKITGKIEEAESLVSALSRRIDDIKARVGNTTIKPKVYMETWYPPPWTWGPGSWGHQIIELAGGVNVFGDAKTAYVKTTDEEVIARNPDIIISLTGAMHYASLDDFRKRPGWSVIKAVAEGRVYMLDENLFVRPGPRIVDGLEALARILHPELFGEANVFTFPIFSAELKVKTQKFSIPSPMIIDICIIKAAADSTLTVILTKSGPTIPANLRLVGEYVDLRCSVPEGFTYTLRIHYSEDLLKTVGVREDSLKIYRWSEEKKQWIALNTAVNKGERFVEATIVGGSYFAVMGEPTPTLLEITIPLWLLIISVVVVAALTGACVHIAHVRSRKRQ
jgi:iron complex transport system substrate-binding protein